VFDVAVAAMCGPSSTSRATSLSVMSMPV
jgi:hypothetical protein